MSIVETILVYAVIPAGIIGVVAALVLSGGRRTQPDRRYRPGRPWNFKPIWFMSAPPAPGSDAGHAAHAIESSSGAPVRPAAVGGASDRW